MLIIDYEKKIKVHVKKTQHLIRDNILALSYLVFHPIYTNSIFSLCKICNLESFYLIQCFIPQWHHELMIIQVQTLTAYLFLNRVCLHSITCPGTCYEDQASPGLLNAVIKVSATIPSLKSHMLYSLCIISVYFCIIKYFLK